jgi:hypothetical protein
MSPRPTPPPPDRNERALHEALLDLAYDASSYLRHHARATVRVSAALLIAASLAACGPSAPTGGSGVIPVAPLSQEIRQGLPTQPGRYPIVPGSLGRDSQGVYHFAWRGPNDAASVANYADASLLQLAQGATPELDIPAQGDPTLYLPADASIPLVNSASDLRTIGGGGYSYPVWHPFSGGYRGTGYYDPPVRTVGSPSGSVDGAQISKAPAPPAQRTVGLSRAVSGRAGGTGSGTAASTKSGAGVSSSSAPVGAAAAKSSSFSSGHGGVSGASGGASSS